MQKTTPQVKVVLVGDSGVGKTSLSNMFCRSEFNQYQETTMGAAFQTKMVLVNDKPINFSIWDTAGQEQFKAIVSLYYRDAQVALIVYDITSYRSFEKCKNWARELEEKGPKNMIKILVGNKVDMIEQEEVKYDEASKYARDISASLKLTSAKENKGIVELFNQLAQKILYDRENDEVEQAQEQRPPVLLNQQSPKTEQKKQQDDDKCAC